MKSVHDICETVLNWTALVLFLPILFVITICVVLFSYWFEPDEAKAGAEDFDE